VTNPLAAEQYLSTIEIDARRMVEVAAATDRHARVPTCPEWAMADLIAHTAKIHRWAAAMVASGQRVRASELPTPPPGLEPEFMADGIEPLLSALSNADPDGPCWNFTGSSQTNAFWPRRQAHETTMHRIDAELAAGTAITAQAPAMAADLMDEKLRLLSAYQLRQRDGIDVGGSVRFACTDVDASWTVHTTDGVFAVEQASERGDVTLSGSAHALSLVSWGRPLSLDIDVTGNAAIAPRLLRLLAQ
jgi:uncharacterized protein (TIGR03083 family)